MLTTRSPSECFACLVPIALSSKFCSTLLAPGALWVFTANAAARELKATRSWSLLPFAGDSTHRLWARTLNNSASWSCLCPLSCGAWEELSATRETPRHIPLEPTGVLPLSSNSFLFIGRKRASSVTRGYRHRPMLQAFRIIILSGPKCHFCCLDFVPNY